jgi:hypothetical protein
LSQQKKTQPDSDFIPLFLSAYERVLAWRVEANDRAPSPVVFNRATDGHLRRLLGVNDNNMRYWNPEAFDILRALEGPNGYTVYRILLVKRGMTMDD